MDTSLIMLFVFQLFLIFILANLLYIIYKESKSLSYENRLFNYSVASVEEQNIPIFEKLYIILFKIIKKIIPLI